MSLNELDQLAEEFTLQHIVTEHGTTWYYNENNEFHRVYGPAVTWKSGDEYWYQNGKKHRLDGPAVIYPSGRKFWYIDDVPYSEEQFNAHPDVITYAESNRT